MRGDFNFRDKNWKLGEAPVNSEHFKFLQSINNSYWIQNVLEMTRFRINQTPSLLDLVFTRSLGEVGDISYEPSLGKSDHLVLNFSVMTDTIHSDMELSQHRDWTKTDFKLIRNELKKIKWTDKFNDMLVNDCYNAFLDIYQDIKR